MKRSCLIMILLGMISLSAVGALKRKAIVVVDSVTRTPLASASVFDKNGKFMGMSSSRGVISFVSRSDFPINVRYIGFKERMIEDNEPDTILMQESFTELPAVIVSSKQRRMLHVLAYTREYSTLSTYTDTVSMFREKMVDFMIPEDDSKGNKGWRNPRVLSSKSYYQYTNSERLDSVTDRCNYHFTWSDWVGILPPIELPGKLNSSLVSTDTLLGKYSPREIWVRNEDRVRVNIDILADRRSRKWVPNFHQFFQNNVDFDRFTLQLNYNNVIGNSLNPMDITGYSFNIESRGRGHGMFKFNKVDEPFYVTTYTEVYILDKEYITMKEVMKWERNLRADGMIEIFPSPDAPELDESTLRLISRVESINHEGVRQTLDADKMMIGRGEIKRNFGQNVLREIKGWFGIDNIVGARKKKKEWHNFRLNQLKKNKARISG